MPDTPTLTSIVVSPSPAQVPASGSTQFTAVARDQSGNPLAPQPVITWTATAGAINNAGYWTAPATGGPVTITATSGSVTGLAAVTVTPPPPKLLPVQRAMVGRAVTLADQFVNVYTSAKLLANGSTDLLTGDAALTDDELSLAVDLVKVADLQAILALIQQIDAAMSANDNALLGAFLRLQRNVGNVRTA